MSKTYGDLLCSYRLNLCYWNKPCERVSKENYIFKMEIYDDAGTMFLTADEHEFRMNGEQFGADPNNCYIPVFRSQIGLNDLWLVGSIFMKKYYIVYDMTPYDERSQTYI